jgi:hypothetical protein
VSQAEVLAQMAQSDDVRKRGRAVIALWLADNTEMPDVLDAADELIKAMGDAELLTFIKADLDRHIQSIINRHRSQEG